MSQSRFAAIDAVILQTFSCTAELALVIRSRARIVRYDPRSTIVSGAAASAQVFLMLAGHAQALALSIDARQVVIEEFFPGDLFGEGSLAQSMAVAQIDVQAVTQVQTGQFRNDTFIGLIESYPAIALTVSRLLTQRLIQATRRMVAVTTLSAPGRIHAELHRLAAASGTWTLSPAPVLSELARQVQTTRETVSRTISQLERRGVIVRTPTRLTVIAPHRLEELIY